MEKKEIPLMEIEQFTDYIHSTTRMYAYLQGVNKFKSVNRAIKRFKMTETGFIIPKRPFNNRKNTSKRKGKNSKEFNEYKKKLYEQCRGKFFN